MSRFQPALTENVLGSRARTPEVSQETQEGAGCGSVVPTPPLGFGQVTFCNGERGDDRERGILLHGIEFWAGAVF